MFKEDPRLDSMIDPAEMRRVNRQPTLVGLARVSRDP
jgi:hypothetical protein